MKRTVISLSVLVAFSFGLGACASAISDEAKANLDAPVDCGTAAHDIATLESEKASTAKQVASGVGSVLPVAAVGNLLQGQYDDGVQVATGSYNRAIEDKIDEIKVTCDIQ